jgi:putative transcriptional regulator
MPRRSKVISDKIVRSLDELATALARGDKISAKFKCHKITLDLKPLPYSPKAVKATRKLLRVSQAVFAQFLDVQTSTVQSWEQGRQEPSGPACRIMDDIQRNPEYWRQRLREAIRVNAGC